jgi:hypothetical protein
MSGCSPVSPVDSTVFHFYLLAYTRLMEPNSFEGVWEDVAKRYADALKGHRVEVRVLDSQKSTDKCSTWDRFESRIRKISSGWRIPGGRVYSAEDFYESAE